MCYPTQERPPVLPCSKLMARYYFDVRDDEALVADAEGFEFGSLEAARAEASRALAKIARDRGTRVDRLDLRIDVRDARRELLFEVRLMLDVVPPPGVKVN